MNLKLDIKERNIFLSTQINQETMMNVSKQIVEINNSDAINKKLFAIEGIDYKPKPIKVFIDSYGGDVYPCFGLIGHMKNSAIPIHTIVTGCAMSCGFLILINGHRRFAFKDATPLYHQVSSDFYGPVESIVEDLKEAERLQEKIEKMTLERTKITKKKLAEIRDKKVDWYMTAKEALKLGVVDEII